MNGLYIVFVTGVFGFILFNLLNNKKVSFVSIVLFILLTLCYCIKRFDREYYDKLVEGITHIDLYLKIAAGCSFGISVGEYVLGYFLHKKKQNKKNKVEEHQQNIIEDMNDDKQNIQPVTNKDNVEDLLVYLELMDEPLACLVNDEYIVNNRMKNLLNIDSYKISKELFLCYLNKEDKKEYNDKNKINAFRLNVGDKDCWYEESKASLKGSIYKLVRESKNIKLADVNLKSFKELTNVLVKLKKERKNYYLVFFDLINTSDISGFYGKDFTNMVINRFLQKISNLSYLNKTRLYYISKTEYVILLGNKMEYNILLSELDNKSSDILRQEITINNKKVILKSKIGAIESARVKDNTVQNVINKGFETLKLASSINYKGDYAIYNPVDDFVDYSARDLNIDLDSDMDEYKKRLK